jgi:hypothetical protein
MSNGNQMLPIRKEIARRTYELYVARDRQNGGDVEDWLTTEKELQGQVLRRSGSPSLDGEGHLRAGRSELWNICRAGKGFQYGRPQSPPKQLSVELFPENGHLDLIFGQKQNGAAVISQADIKSHCTNNRQGAN